MTVRLSSLSWDYSWIANVDEVIIVMCQLWHVECVNCDLHVNCDMFMTVMSINSDVSLSPVSVNSNQ